jgi:hypothetical protein
MEELNNSAVLEEVTEEQTREVSEEQRTKQAEAMKKRWEDPEYRERVAEGRAKAKAAREAAESEVADEE